MSLMHDALRDLDTPPSSSPTAAPMPAWAHGDATERSSPKAARFPRGLLWGLGIGVTGALAAWLLWTESARTWGAPAVAEAAAMRPTQPAAAASPVFGSSPTPVAQVESSGGSAAEASPDERPPSASPAESAPLELPQTARVAPTAHAQVTAIAQPAASSQQRAGAAQRPVPARTPVRLDGVYSSGPQTVEASTAAAPPLNVDQAWDAAMRAIDSSDAARWQEIEREMERTLGSQALPLLRLRAYAALVQQREVEAGTLYQQILERLPHDEEASLNLAVLKARIGNWRQAQALLDDALQSNPDSAALRAAQRQLREAVRSAP